MNRQVGHWDRWAQLMALDALVPSVAAGLVCATVLVGAALLGPQRLGSPAHWELAVGALGAVVAGPLLMIVSLVKSGHRGDAHVSVLVSVASSVLASAGVVMVQMTVNGQVMAVVVVVMICVLAVAALGRPQVSAGTALAGVAGVGVVLWHAHVGALEAGQDMVLCAIAVGALWVLASRALRSGRELAAVRGGIAALEEAMTEAPTVNEGLKVGLSLVNRVVPTDHVVVLARTGTNRASVPLFSWPVGDSTDAALGEMVGLEEALSTGRVVRVGSYSFLPIGYSGSDQLALALHHSGRKRGAIGGSVDNVELVAAAFLKLTARAAFVEELRRESRTDPLTGLPNRRALLERLDAEMRRSARFCTPLAICMLDLDYFKQYNDRFGHVQGDNLLRSVAALFVSAIRGRDLAARYGGEEFVVVLPDTDSRGAQVLMDRLRNMVREADPNAPVTLSVGLTTWNGIDSAAQAIERADQALYSAKARGRDRVVVYGDMAAA